MAFQNWAKQTNLMLSTYDNAYNHFYQAQINQQAVVNPQGEDFVEALVWIGFINISAQEFVNNGIVNLARLRALTTDALDRLI